MATKGCYRRPAGQDQPADAAPREARLGLLTTGLGAPRPGPGSPWRWFFSAIWLVYLIAPVSALFGHGHGVWWIAGGLAITIAFCLLYVGCWASRSARTAAGLARAGLVAMAVLAALACVVYGKDWTPLWIYVSAATGMILAGTPGGRRLGHARGLRRRGLLPLLQLALPRRRRGFLRRPAAGPAHRPGHDRLPAADCSSCRSWPRPAETVAKLAANDERLRLARDMHDLTGQSLSMITLKAELAAKRLSRLQPSAERDAALSDLGDIAGVSRQTLHDIREAVSGYRRPTLAIEAITARNALEAAGIQLDDDPGLTLRSGTLRRRSRGGPGLVPARGGDQRDPARRRDGLPDPPDRAFRRALPRNRR